MRLNLHLRGRDSNASLKNESVKRRTYFKQQSTEAKEINYNPGNLIKHKKIYHKKKLDRKLVPQKTVGTTNLKRLKYNKKGTNPQSKMANKLYSTLSQ
jgi:hypothetical protein